MSYMLMLNMNTTLGTQKTHLEGYSCIKMFSLLCLQTNDCMLSNMRMCIVFLFIHVHIGLTQTTIKLEYELIG